MNIMKKADIGLETIIILTIILLTVGVIIFFAYYKFAPGTHTYVVSNILPFGNGGS
ncbi:MAG: hypothetical protein V1839_00355 [archaeon]